MMNNVRNVIKQYIIYINSTLMCLGSQFKWDSWGNIALDSSLHSQLRCQSPMEATVSV